MKTWLTLILMAAPLSCAAAAAEPVTMKQRFPVGQTSKFSISMVLDEEKSSSSDSAGQKRQTKMHVDFKQRVLEADDAGATIELSFEKISLSISDSGQQSSFDSTNDNPTDANSLGALRKCVGRKITIHFAPDGMADKIAGCDEIVKSIAEQPADAPIGDLFKTMLGEEQFRQTFNRNLASALPPRPVEIGDQWDSSYSEMDHGVGIKLTTRYKLAGLVEREGRKIARIEFTTDGQFLEKLPAGGTATIGHGSEKGSKQFDLTRGAFVETDREQAAEWETPLPSGDEKGKAKFKRVMKSQIAIVPEFETEGRDSLRK